MIIDNTKYRLPTGKFFAEMHPKDLIVLHFTAGSTTSGAFQSWINQKIQIGTPYILDPTGVVFETFDPKYWAYHLGIPGAASENHRYDKRSVPIEVVSFGPLRLVGEILCAWPNNYRTPYCNIKDTSRYVNATYRGFEYYAAFPEEQKAALAELVRKISTDFSIPVTLPPAGKREKFDIPFFKTWKGVASHQNFLSDKLDIGPAWDWSLLCP